jgi:hypothetical protein
MNIDKAFSNFLSLPAEAQRQVLDYITFLKDRYAPSQPKKAQKSFNKEPFVGMWADREDMSDSTEWVRGARKREWRTKRA